MKTGKQLMERKLVVETKIRMLEENIKAKHTQEKKTASNLSFSQFGFPYFKEKDGTLPGIERFIFFKLFSYQFLIIVYDDWLVLNKILKFKPAFYNKPKPKKISSKQEVKLNEAVLKEIVRIAREQLVNTVTNEYSMKMFIKGLFLFFLLEIFYKFNNNLVIM
jgi:hypothetical protein